MGERAKLLSPILERKRTERQRMWVTARNWKRQERTLPWSLQVGMQPWEHLALSLVGPKSEVQL